MKVYLHSDNAERSKVYRMTVAPAGDTQFNRPNADGEYPKEWVHPSGEPIQFEIIFAFGAAEVEDSIGRYMVARGIAHKTRLLRKVRQFFTRDGKPIEELFDERGEPVIYDTVSA